MGKPTWSWWPAKNCRGTECTVVLSVLRLGGHKHQLERLTCRRCCIHQWLNRQVKVTCTLLWERISPKPSFTYCFSFLLQKYVCVLVTHLYFWGKLMLKFTSLERSPLMLEEYGLREWYSLRSDIIIIFACVWIYIAIDIMRALIGLFCFAHRPITGQQN